MASMARVRLRHEPADTHPDPSTRTSSTRSWRSRSTHVRSRSDSDELHLESTGTRRDPLAPTSPPPVSRPAGKAAETLDPTSIPQDRPSTKGKSMRGAGGGSFPNPHGIRRNRKPLREVVKLRADVSVAEVPEPALPLTEAGRELWDRVWSHPVAQLWTEADVGGLSRMVAMQSDPASHSDPKKLAEIRQLEDRYLLSPYARRAQRVELVDEDEEPVDPAVVAIAEYRRQLGADRPR